MYPHFEFTSYNSVVEFSWADDPIYEDHELSVGSYETQDLIQFLKLVKDLTMVLVGFELVLLCV